MTFEPHSSIERCAHDKENPYAQISRDLIRDENISPMLRWLLIYLLSNRDGWKINPRQIINHLKPQGIGKKKVYSLFREGIEAGYIERFTVLHNNLTRVKYRISETPKFKKCFRRSPNGDPEDRDAEEGTYKEEHQKEEYKKEEIRPTSRPSPSVASAPAKPPPPSAKASELSFLLLRKILEMKPDLKKPDAKKWSEVMERLIRIDKKDPNRIAEVIEWVFTDEFWRLNILSPDKLRKHFERLDLQMTQKASQSPEARITAVHAWIQSNNKEEWLKQAKRECVVDWGRDWMEFKGCLGSEGHIKFSDPRAVTLIDHWIRKVEKVKPLRIP